MIVPVTIVPVRPVSPSQISTFMECQRKWAWRHVAKIVLPAHKSAALGTDTHSQLEEYLKTGKTFDYTKPSGYIAQSAVHLLPPPMTKGLELERHFTFMSKSGYSYHGYMDVSGPDSGVFPDMQRPANDIATVLAESTWRIFDNKTGMCWSGDEWVFLDPLKQYVASRSPLDDDRDMVELRPLSARGVTPFVSDHKTTSDFRYAKSPADLRKDPQGIIYAMAVMDYYKSDQADLIWTYMLTKGARKAKRVHLRVLREDVEKEFAKIELVAGQIVTTHLAQPSPLTLPPAGPDACEAYGGCPYIGNCIDLSAINRQGKKMTQATEDFLNSMTQQMPASERPAPVVTETASAFTGLPDWMTAEVDPIKKVTNTILPPPPADASSVDPLAGLLPQTQVLINPPGEAEPASASLLPPPAPPVAKPAGTRAKRRSKEEMAAARAAETVAPGPLVAVQADTYTGSEPATIPAPAQCETTDRSNAEIFYAVVREVIRDIVVEVLAAKETT